MPPPPAQPSDSQSAATGFFGALFDFSFTTFITPKLVRIMYVLGAVGIAIYLLFALMIALSSGRPLLILPVLVVGPIAAIFMLAMLRLTLEFYLAVVRMSEDIHQRLPRG